MTFEELRDFITSKMKMSHIYQPLLISPLLILVEYQPSDNEQQPSYAQMKVKSSLMRNG